MKKQIITVAAAMSAIVVAPQALAATGYVTPTSIRMVITELAVIKAGGSPTADSLTISDDEYDITFRKSDTDFAKISLGAIPVPEGRWDGMRICYRRLRDVVVAGEKYSGQTTAGGIQHGDDIWISATDGTVSKVNPGGTITLKTTDAGKGTRDDTTCSTGMFARTACISPDPDSCEPGDEVVDPSMTIPDITLIADMYNAISVVDGKIPWGGFYPYPVVGDPGAAAHFNAVNGTDVADLTLLFNNKGSLMFAAASGTTGGSWCSGQGFVKVTGAPSGVLINNPTPVMKLESSGKLQFAAGVCPENGSCGSQGMMVVDDVFVAQGATTTARCIADSAATPPYLGYTYTSGAGSAGGNSTITLARIVDPKRVVYSATECADASGICGDYP